MTCELSCLQPGAIRMLEFWTGVWLRIDVMLNSGNLSQGPVPHVGELGKKTQCVLL